VNIKGFRDSGSAGKFGRPRVRRNQGCARYGAIRSCRSYSDVEPSIEHASRQTIVRTCTMAFAAERSFVSRCGRCTATPLRTSKALDFEASFWFSR